jgi:mono/diheme cytochrome c family protein
VNRLTRALLGLAAAVLLSCWSLLTWQRLPATPSPATAATADLGRGAYLARVGNCAGCHTATGGIPFAGGRGLPTPFGTVFSTNLTPDPDSGLGRWSADDFWGALHLGRRPDGQLLSPAFPYVNTTRIRREDADALFAYLRSLPASPAPARPNELRWPYGTQLALAAWRALFFRPGAFEPDPARGPAWNRGAYLTQGLAHCSACHSQRNALGGDAGPTDFGGGRLFGLGWTAPSLHDPAEAGVQAWSPPALRQWLREGRNAQQVALGPMSEVILGSTTHLNDADLEAMGVYLQSLPQMAVPRPTPALPQPRRRERGAALYDEHCAACHGRSGEGRLNAAGEPAYPALSGNRTVTQGRIDNLVRIIERGGFAPATPGNPRPYGMPPFAGQLGAEDLAALASHLRTAFGNQAGEVDTVDVLRLRDAAEQR